MHTRKVMFLWVMALLFVALVQCGWAQSPAPGSSTPATVSSAAPAVSASAALAPSQAAAPAASTGSGSPAAPPPASTAPGSASPADSGSPAWAPTGVPSPAPSSALPALPPFTTTEIKELPSQPSFVASLFQTFVLILYFLVCVALIVCVMFQTTKNEGLTGIMGGGTSTTLFKGKKSAEEQLNVWTSRLAWTFLLSSMCIWLVMQHG